MTKVKTTKRVKQGKCLISPEAYKGMVVQQAKRCHEMLSPSIRASVGIDDLVQDGMLFLFRVLNAIDGRKAKFDTSKAASSTWVHSMLTNMYKGHAEKLNAKKRFAETVPLDDNFTAFNKHSAYSTHPSVLDAQAKLDRLHQMASLDLVFFLDRNLFQPHRTVDIPQGQRLQALRTEFRSLANRFGVTIDDYTTVLRHAQPTR